MAGNEFHDADWDEHLSAYADGQIDAPARAAIEAHLPACARCQSMLADLRGVKTLLGAMPAPKVPRSFAIPEAGPSPLAAHRGTTARVVRRKDSNAGRIAQWLGGIAAAVGLALLLGTALIHTPTAASSTASAPRYSAAGARASTATVAPTKVTSGVQSMQTPDNASAEPGASATTPAATSTPGAAGQAPTIHEQGGQVSQPPIAPIAGAALLLAGSGLYLAGRSTKRNQRASRD